MKKVITLHDHEFEEACMHLKERIGKFVPDLVVAIPTGGRYVATSMFSDESIVEISHHRPSTERKKHNNCLRWIMKKAPYPILDMMRIIESYVLQLRRPEIKAINHAHIDSALIRRVSDAHDILVVDDAIDSGATIGAVLRFVKELAPQAKVKTAVLTVSTSAPIVKPDFCIYNNNTLIRFPWSMDMKT